MAPRPQCWSLSTNRIKFVVAYDGTDFCGWAAQAGRRTVQGTLTEAVRQVSGEDIEITGASRTDSGAHAKGQVCHFDTEVPIATDVWPRAVNRVLPPDVRVVQTKRMQPSFHSRFCARDRAYRYAILLSGDDPFKARYAHECLKTLNLLKMQEAGGLLVGRHDYRAFTEDLQPHIENTVRTMRTVNVRQVQNLIYIDIVGTAFLRGMMRRMAGALYEVGRGRRSIENVAELLTQKRGEMHWPEVLPAKGLTLMAIRYGRHPKDNRNNETASF